MPVAGDWFISNGVPWVLCSCRWRRCQSPWIQSVLHKVDSGTRLPTTNHTSHTGWAKKRDPPNSWPLFCVDLTDLQNFSTRRFRDTFAEKWLLNVPHLAYVAALPCETLMSENKRLTINYKAVWLHIKGVVGCHKQVKKVCQWIFLNRWTFDKVTSKKVHFLRLLAAWWLPHC